MATKIGYHKNGVKEFYFTTNIARIAYRSESKYNDNILGRFLSKNETIVKYLVIYDDVYKQMVYEYTKTLDCLGNIW